MKTKKLTIRQWLTLDEFPFIILDYDGFNQSKDGLDTLYTKEEFNEKLMRCTIKGK